MAKTFRLAATQVAFPWSDKGHRVNPYGDEFDPSALPAHVERNIRLQLDLFQKAGQMGADLVVGAEDMQRLGHFGQYLDDPGPFRSLVETIPGATSKRVAAVARKYRMYVVACYPEKNSMTQSRPLVGRPDTPGNPSERLGTRTTPERRNRWMKFARSHASGLGKGRRTTAY